MGTSTSKTRKLTVENDDPTNVIKVSEDVVDRLRGSQVSQVVRQDPQQTFGLLQNPQIIAGPQFLHEPSLTSLQLRQASITELKSNDEYWENRLKAQEANHKKMNEIMDQEFNKAVQELQGKTPPLATKIQPPCQDTKKAVIECYTLNPKEPMRCAKVVQAFQECVDSKRSCLIANRG